MSGLALQHLSVLLPEAVDALVTDEDGIYVDGTFGRGGHSRAILERLSPQGRLIAFDRDPAAIASAAADAGFSADPRFSIEHTAFSAMTTTLAARGVAQVSGVLLDLGVSSPQIDDPERGFSFRFEGPLDMRMDTTRGESAAEFLARADERHIAEVIRDYGEERLLYRLQRRLLLGAKAGALFEPPASLPTSWLVRSGPEKRARTLQRARFRLFGFSSTPSLRSSSRP